MDPAPGIKDNVKQRLNQQHRGEAEKAFHELQLLVN